MPRSRSSRRFIWSKLLMTSTSSLVSNSTLDRSSSLDREEEEAAAMTDESQSGCVTRRRWQWRGKCSRVRVFVCWCMNAACGQRSACTCGSGGGEAAVSSFPLFLVVRRIPLSPLLRHLNVWRSRQRESRHRHSLSLTLVFGAVLNDQRLLSPAPPPLTHISITVIAITNRTSAK